MSSVCHSRMMLRSPVPRGAICFEKNPTLEGLSALHVLDEVVLCLGRHRVAVILNNHTTYGEWCGPPGRNGLWFDPGGSQTEAQWMEDWAMLASRYSKCVHVVGYDLRNEIRASCNRCKVRWPGWGSSKLSRFFGCCDWGRAAITISNRLLQISPCALIVIERIVWPQRGLRPYAKNPGRLLPRLHGRLVLGVHHYSWSGPGRFIPGWAIPRRLHCMLRSVGLIARENYGDMQRVKLQDLLTQEWGFALDANICPVWVSEFGANLADSNEMNWLEMFTSFLAKKGADWAYWPLNVGPKPGSQEGEPYGMLNDDWTASMSSRDKRLELLRTIGLPQPQSQAFGHVDARASRADVVSGQGFSLNDGEVICTGAQTVGVSTMRLDVPEPNLVGQLD